MLDCFNKIKSANDNFSVAIWIYINNINQFEKKSLSVVYNCYTKLILKYVKIDFVQYFIQSLTLSNVLYKVDSNPP